IRARTAPPPARREAGPAPRRTAGPAPGSPRPLLGPSASSWPTSLTSRGKGAARNRKHDFLYIVKQISYYCDMREPPRHRAALRAYRNSKLYRSLTRTLRVYNRRLVAALQARGFEDF